MSAPTTRAEARRAYNREWRRRQREAARCAENAARLTCGVLLARGRPCKAPLQNRFVNGETVPFCPVHDRKARGVCVTCGEAPVAGTRGRALFCPLCRKLAKQANGVRYQAGNARRRYRTERTRMTDPAKRADKLAYKKLYRQAAPAKIAEHKRLDYQRNREKYLAYHRQYRAKKKGERAAVEMARYHGTLPPRTCLYCPTVLAGRPKVCPSCKAARRVQARAAIAERLGVAA